MHLWKKHKEIITYIFWGVAATGVNWLCYSMFVGVLHLDINVGNILSWLITIIFAFITNKLFVFQSTSLKLSRLFSELVSFVACRLFTGILTIAGMELMVNGLGWSNLFGKIAVSVLSLVLNYILSKLFIFRGREAVSEKQGK